MTRETRSGIGFDAHAWGEDRPLRLGGVEIDHPRGLTGHSDADVLLHAIADAVLGAAALGDIGGHFPPGDPRWKDADSRELLRRAVGLAGEHGWRVVHVDATLLAEAPRVAPHAAAMRAAIGAALGIAAERVNVKATTTEGMGFVGREEGIAALAVVTVRRGEGDGDT